MSEEKKPRGRPRKSTAESKTTKKATTKKKTTKKATKKTARRGRPRKQPEEPVVEVEETVEEAPQKPVSESYTLLEDMFFGLVNESFKRGYTFSVDWSGNCMRCDNTGRLYENAKDLDIAIRLGKAAPSDRSSSEEAVAYHERYADEQSANIDSRIAKRKQHDDEVRSRVEVSDSDLISPIDISHTRKSKADEGTPQKAAPRSHVSLIKRRDTSKPEIIESHSAQPGVRVSSVLTQNNWDAKNAGALKKEIQSRETDYSIINDGGQRKIRGLAIISDDASVVQGSSSGSSSLNAGQVTSMSKEQLAERNERARARAASVKKELNEKRKHNGVEVQETDQQFESVDSEVSNQRVKKLLSRRG